MIAVTTVSTTEREERAYKRFVECVASALREYDDARTEDERAFEARCQCELCEGMRLTRALVRDYQGVLGAWRVRLLHALDARAEDMEGWYL